MDANAIAIKKKGDKSKSMSMMIMMGLLFRLSRKKNSKVEHPIIPYGLSQAWEIARPYRPRLVLNLPTIREEEDPSETPLCEDPTRTPAYFPESTNTKRFRFRFPRYAKLTGSVHYAASLRGRFTNVLRLFRITSDTESQTDVISK